MFGANITLPRCGILAYEEAVIKHDSIKLIRGRSTDIRPLGRRSNDNLTIRRLHDDSIAVRLYHTDIITYRPDGTIELEPYASRLTDDAVRQIFRGSVTPQYTNPAGPVLWVRHKGYRIPSCAVLDKDLNLISGSVPFTKYSVDRKLSNEVMRTSGFNQFALWLRTQVRLGIDPRQGDRWAGQYIDRATPRCLDQPSCYGDIVRLWSTYKSVDEQLRNLRLQVQKYYDCITEAELAYVSDWLDLNSVVASQRKYG
jgi:hypothetical protein